MSLSWDEGFLQDGFCVWVCACETQHGVLESDQLAWELETWISKSVFVVTTWRGCLSWAITLIPNSLFYILQCDQSCEKKFFSQKWLHNSLYLVLCISLL